MYEGPSMWAQAAWHETDACMRCAAFRAYACVHACVERGGRARGPTCMPLGRPPPSVAPDTFRNTSLLAGDRRCEGEGGGGVGGESV
jgi:hypothetical protein